MAIYKPLFLALNEAGVRYVIVGGVATVLHGYTRMTADIDLAVDLEPTAAKQAIEALTAMGLRPRVPVDPMGYADPVVRQQWIEKKGMMVFSLWQPEDSLLSVDLFVEEPIPFEHLWDRSQTVELGDLTVRVAAIDDLIELKRRAGRPQDKIDIAKLEEIKSLKEQR